MSLDNLPVEWILSNVGKVLNNTNNLRKPVSSKEREKIKGDYPYYGATGKIDALNSYTHDGEYILMGEDGANLLSRVKDQAFVVKGKFWVNNHAHSLQASCGMPSNFFAYYLNQVDLQPFITGSAQPKLTRQNLDSIPMVVVPLAEQQEIVRQLDMMLAQVEQIKARLDAIPAILKKFRQSVLADAVSGKLTEEWREQEKIKPQIKELQDLKDSLIKSKEIKKDLEVIGAETLFEIPENWGNLALQSFASKITDGEHSTPKRESAGHYLLSARNVRDGYIDVSNVDYVGIEEFSKLRKRCDPNKGDVLISCSGSVGRIALVDKDDEYVMVRSAALVKTLDSFIDNKFLMYVLQSPYLQKQIDEKSKSTAQSNLFLGQIKELSIPYPSLKEQKEIVQQVESLFKNASLIETAVQSAQKRVNLLTQSILAKAFSGELTAEWREQHQDLITGVNSAEALLAKIQAEREASKPVKKAKKVK